MKAETKRSKGTPLLQTESGQQTVPKQAKEHACRQRQFTVEFAKNQVGTVSNQKKEGPGNEGPSQSRRQADATAPPTGGAKGGGRSRRERGRSGPPRATAPTTESGAGDREGRPYGGMGRMRRAVEGDGPYDGKRSGRPRGSPLRWDGEDAAGRRGRKPLRGRRNGRPQGSPLRWDGEDAAGRQRAAAPTGRCWDVGAL